MKKMIVLMCIAFFVLPTACKKKTCPAYMSQDEMQKESDKQMNKNLKKRSHSKVKMN